MTTTRKLFVLSLLVSLFITAAGAMGFSDQAPVKIGISQIVAHPALDSVRDAVIDRLAEEGYHGGENVEFLLKNAQGEFSNALSIAQTFRNQNVDIVVPIATPTAQASAQVFDRTPLVVSAVTNFVEAGLVDSYEDYESPENNGNITGVTDMTPVRRQLELITELDPQVEKVGIVYNPGEANSRYLTQVAEEISAEIGIEIVKATANETSEVKMAADSLKGRVGAVWVSTDNTVVSALPSVVTMTLEEEIPLVTADPTTISDGPLASFGWSYYRHGWVTGEVVVRILEGEKPNEIPIQELEATEENINLALNLNTSEAIPLSVPETIKNEASQLFYGERLWKPLD